MKIAQWIDHTLLAPEATRDEIIQICKEAKHYEFASVCIQPLWVKEAAKQLKDSSVSVCTVIGFPLGAQTADVKAFETKEAIRHGATEIDMVIPIGALKSGEDEIVEKHIRAVVEAAVPKAIVKVIIETALLTDDEKVRACRLAEKAGAHYVKTSTGFSTTGATVEDVQLMRASVTEKVGIKAAGGIRTLEDVKAYVSAGATRIGASRGVEIVQSAQQK